jgi:hypothetical protein
MSVASLKRDTTARTSWCHSAIAALGSMAEYSAPSGWIVPTTAGDRI